MEKRVGRGKVEEDGPDVQAFRRTTKQLDLLGIHYGGKKKKEKKVPGSRRKKNDGRRTPEVEAKRPIAFIKRGRNVHEPEGEMPRLESDESGEEGRECDKKEKSHGKKKAAGGWGGGPR